MEVTTFEDIERLALARETREVELKRSTAELPKACQTVCAYLNDGISGVVLLGVTPGGRVVGQDVSDGTRQKLAKAFGKLDPPVHVGVGYVEVPGTPRKVIVLSVERGRAPIAPEATVEDTLRRLHLLGDDGFVTQGAVVLFAGDPGPLYPQCFLRLARFKGVTKDEFLDNRQVRGHAFRLLEEATLFLQRHLPIAGTFDRRSLYRKDEPLFPPEALREALVNAVCHRDYRREGGSVGVAIFDDRLEISSTGTLPEGVRLEDLKTDHTSCPRNPDIAQVFYLRGLVERWGRGTQKIVRLCVEAGHPEPEFLERAGEVVVRFRPSRYVAPSRVISDLSAPQRELLELLWRFRTLALRDLREALTEKRSDRAIRKDLSYLRELGLVELEGHGAGACWVFVERPG